MATHPPCLRKTLLRKTLWLAVCSAVVLVFPDVSRSADDEDSTPSFDPVDYVMDFDPSFPVGKYQVIVSGDPIPLWMQALARSEAALQRVTVDTIAIAHQRGMVGIESTLPTLIEMLGNPDLNLDVRRATVRAIIEFDAKDQAPLLVEQAENYGAPIALIVEPAIGRWGSPLLKQRWIDRLQDPGVNRRLLMIAIEGLGDLREQDASQPLQAFVLNASLPTGIRMTAARSLGKIHAAGLVTAASELTDPSEVSVTSDLLAIAFLDQHTDPQTIALLKTLVGRESTVVQSEALARLYEIDHALVLDFVEQSMSSPDVNVRRTVAQAMIDARAKQWITPLATLLDDVNPGLRRHVAKSLFQLAQQAELKDEIIARVSGVLDQDAWRGCEQAALILVNLEHKDAGDRLVDLISHPRGEVMVTAGWGLVRFGEKKHLPAMLGRAREVYAGFQAGERRPSDPGYVDLMAQLFLAFGQMKYREADDLARAYVPKTTRLGVRSRAAAVWALGYLYEDDAQDDLTDAFIGRIKDLAAMDPEYEAVARMAAVSLGRMKAEAGLPILRSNATKLGSTFSQSCHWSIEQITGKKPPTFPPPRPLDYDDWFLSPLASEQ